MLGAYRGGVRSSCRHETGATLVEFALILPILLVVILGITEFGLAFKDFLSVSNAAREGARIASSAGNEPDADCAVLGGLSDSLTALSLDRLDRVEIFKGIPGGGQDFANTNTYSFVSGDPADCANWTSSVLWDPTSRDTTTGPSGPLDIIGVRLVYDHVWITNFGPFGGTWQLDQSIITRMEPEAFE